MRERMINVKATGFAVLFAFSLIGCNNVSKKVNKEIKNEISELVDMSLIILEEGLPIILT